MRNYFSIDDDGSLELRFGPLYVTSLSQLEPVPGDELHFSFGFFDIYFDAGRFGLLHLGLGSSLENNFILERLDVF